MKPYLDKCPVCGQVLKNREDELRHGFLHARGERKTQNVNFRIQPSRYRALQTLAREYNFSVSEAVSHAIKETWNV